MRDRGIVVRVDGNDIALRNLTYRLFVELGRAPTVEEAGAAAHSSAEDIRAGWARLHREHALVLESAAPEIRMANPFSAVPTAHRVRTAGRWWFASCAWDAFGICAALHTDGHIETSCPDCGDRLDIAVRDGSPDNARLLFHCLMPASQWWDDIVFT